jgi:hypothetical protein
MLLPQAESDILSEAPPKNHFLRWLTRRSGPPTSAMIRKAL